MKKRFARIIAVMLCAVTILVMTPVAVLASEGYTYNYDWGMYSTHRMPIRWSVCIH